MLTPAQLGTIRNYDVCAIIDAIESLGVRLRNEGFTMPGLRCFTMREPRLLGYAATFQVRSSNPPVTGGTFLEQTDWWPAPGTENIPRIAVIQDLEPQPMAACVGELHSALFRGLGYHGVITNGAVRGLPALRHMRFPVFARFIGASRAYTHVVGHGHPVEILGLKIQEGDLLYADCHGVVSIPAEIAGKVAEAASRIRAKEARLVQACLSAHISRAELREMIQNGL
jgi:regulator of RNase E activity RraA